MSADLATANGAAVVHQKSFKRKYKKLRHKFKDVMKQSDELFKQEQLATSAIRRMQEENTRILDFLVDQNESSHLPKERKHNIGSPSRATPPRFLSPTALATITGGDLSILNPDDDVDELDLERQGDKAAPEAAPKPASESSSSDDEDDKTSTPNSDDENDDREAYLEEVREENYRRGIPGTPPRHVMARMKLEAEQERRNAEGQTKKALDSEGMEKRNGELDGPVEVKREDGEATDEKGELKRRLILEDYKRGRTPEYLKDSRPFLMTLEEEDEWYKEIDTTHEFQVPPLQYPPSPSAARAESDPRNPMSVYCWLRKHQPQVFLQGEEGEGKRPGRGRGGRRKAAEVDSGDEGASVVGRKPRGDPDGQKPGKRRRVNGDEHGEPSSRGSGSGRGGRGGSRGGRRKDGEPPQKRQRR